MFTIEPRDSLPPGGRESHFIIAAGAPEADPHGLEPYLVDSSTSIAADGGLRLLQQLNRRPSLLIGDLDTVTAAEVAACEAEGTTVSRHPVDKDQSDLELALREAHQRGAERVTILGALGGQWDHSIHNILAPLSLCQRLGLWGRLVTADCEVYLLKGSSTVHSSLGRRASVAALSAEVRGLGLRGFRYPLENQTLHRHQTLGLANTIMADPASIEIESGEVLLTLMS